MIYRPVRELIIAIVFLGFTWAAQGQIGEEKSSKEFTNDSNSFISNDFYDPAAFRDSLSQNLSELISYESAVLQELRRGLDRLVKGCTSSSVPKSEAENALLSRNTLAFEQASAVINARQDSLQRAASTFKLVAVRQVTQHCTAIGSGFGLQLFKSANCKKAEVLQDTVSLYHSQLERYYRLQAERYQTYLDLTQIERQGCVRSGFSNRLLLANQVHMRESEEQSQRLLVQWDRDLSRLLGISGIRP